MLCISFPHQLRTNRKAVLILISSGLFTAALAVSAQAWLMPVKGTVLPKSDTVAKTSTPPVEQDAAPQAAATGEKIEAELITVRPTGFEPAEITRPAGRFILAIDNRSGLEAVSLQLHRETGIKLHEVRIKRGKPDRSDLVNLPPGRYTLTESNNSDWVCHITITPR